MFKKMRCLLVGSVLAFWAQAQAAEVVRETSVFERPTWASKQVEILPISSNVAVSGDEVPNADGTWVHVRTRAGVEGWVIRESVELARSDIAVGWPGMEHSMWVFASAGLTGMSSDDFYYGLRAAAGAQWFVNSRRRFFTGFAVTSPFSKERLTVNFNGKSQRYNTYFTMGYLALPPRTYIRYGVGLPVLAGGNRHFTYKLGISALAEIGHDFIVSENSRFGMSFSYEYTGKSRQSMNFVQDLAHCVLGGCDASNAVPSASIFAINLNYSFAP